MDNDKKKEKSLGVTNGLQWEILMVLSRTRRNGEVGKEMIGHLEISKK